MGKPETQEEKIQNDDGEARVQPDLPVSRADDYQHAGNVVLQHGGHVLRRPDRNQRHRGGRRIVRADGDHPASAFRWSCSAIVFHANGQHRFDEAQQMAATGFFTALALGTVIFFAGGNLDRSFVPDSGATETILPMPASICA